MAPLVAPAAQTSETARLPDFYIVGAPKCGTTALYDYLRQHPQIYMPFHKEPLYFGTDLTRRYGRMTTADYAALFRDAHPEQVVGEASAWYLYSASAAREIRDAAPGARIVVMLRNPVDVMYAQHSQLLFNQQEDIADFRAALEAEEERFQGRRLPPGPIRVENLFYRRMVRFAEQLERYLAVFGPEAVHVIVFEDFVGDTPAVYRETLRFLGVDDRFEATFGRVNENKLVRSRRLQRLVYDPPFVRRLAPVLRRLPMMHRLRARVLAANSTVQQRPAMDADLRRMLTHELEPEIQRLAAILGRDLSAWTHAA